MKDTKRESAKFKLEAAILAFSWKNYKKKCKHCNKFNTYRLKWTSINIDVQAMAQTVEDTMAFGEKRYIELVEAKK